MFQEGKITEPGTGGFEPITLEEIQKELRQEFTDDNEEGGPTRQRALQVIHELNTWAKNAKFNDRAELIRRIIDDLDPTSRRPTVNTRGGKFMNQKINYDGGN